MMDKLVLGTMWFGTRTDEQRSFEILDRFVAAGGVWIDTANSYSFWIHPSGFGGQSEAVLGRWLSSRPGVRDRVRLSTKVGAEPGEVGEWPATAQGLSAAVIKGEIEASLQRLGTDRVDMYWAHMPDPATPLDETVGALDELLEAGTIGRLGFSNYPVWQVERARQLSRTKGVTAVQQHYTYLQPRPGISPSGLRFGGVTDEVRHYVTANRDMALWAYTPMLSGSYTNPDKPFADMYDHPGTTRRLAALDEVATETGMNRIQVVLAWLAGGDPTATPIVGVSTFRQLDEAIAGVSLTLTPDQRERMDAAV